MFIDFRDTSSNGPQTHTIHVDFESHPNYVIDFSPEIHLRKSYRGVFPEPTEPEKSVTPCIIYI